jgi:hypothetical protein
MAPRSTYVISGLAVVAAMIVALPAAKGIDASTKEAPVLQVNRGAKGDRLIDPRTIAVKSSPTETARDIVKTPQPGETRRIMEGCDPMFSPVTVPSMAHLAGRCVG